MLRPQSSWVFFFFNDTATTEIYTLSLHDALPISEQRQAFGCRVVAPSSAAALVRAAAISCLTRSEEHTSELQSRSDLVCRLLLEKKKTTNTFLPCDRDSLLTAVADPDRPTESPRA